MKRYISSDSDIEAILESETKKLRISRTPGELRLSKELDSFSDNDAVLKVGNRATEVFLIFDNKNCMNMERFRPQRFVIEVSRHYPHEPPLVRAVETEYFGAHPHIARDGRVIHPILSKTKWNALLSISDIVTMLKETSPKMDQPYFISIARCNCARPECCGAFGQVCGAGQRHGSGGGLFDDGVGVGAVYIFKRSGTLWSEEAKLAIIYSRLVELFT